MAEILTEEIMKKILTEIGDAVGLEWPEDDHGAFYYRRQLPERVKRAAKEAQLYHNLIEPLKAAIVGR